MMGTVVCDPSHALSAVTEAIARFDRRPASVIANLATLRSGSPLSSLLPGASARRTTPVTTSSREMIFIEEISR